MKKTIGTKCFAHACGANGHSRIACPAMVALVVLLLVAGGCTDARVAPDDPASTGGVASSSDATPSASLHLSSLSLLSADTDTVAWREPYPQVAEYPRAIARLPSTVAGAGLQVAEGPVEINQRHQLLEWNSDALRTTSTQQVRIVDAKGKTQYLFSLTAHPSQFLTDVFDGSVPTVSPLGRIALDQWWVDDTDRSYFYVGGRIITLETEEETTAYTRHYQVIFAHPSASGTLNNPSDDRAVLSARIIEEKDLNIDIIRSPIENSHYSPNLHTKAISNMLRDKATLCAPPSGQRTFDYDHPFTVTRARVLERVPNRNSGRLLALNGSQGFLLLDKEQQRECFAKSYLFEILPLTRPTTTDAHRASLPSGTRYSRNQYDLVWNEEFGSGTTIDSLLEGGYHIGVASRFPGFRVPNYRTTPSPLDDPIKIEDDKLYIGYGVKPKHIGGECDPEKMENPADVINPDKCVIASIVKDFSPPIHFKYGLLEIDFARTVAPSSGLYMWLSSHANWVDWWDRKRDSELQVGYGYPDRYAGARFRESGIGHRPVFSYADTLRWELQYYGSEYQLMEVAHLSHEYRGVATWMVNHYGASLHPTEWIRVYDTYYFNAGMPYRFAIEWTPQGYIVWTDEIETRAYIKGYEKYNPKKFVLSDPESRGQCAKNTNGGKLSTIDGVGGIIQCGIVHVPMQLEFVMRRLSKWTSAKYHKLGNAADPDSRYMEINSLRLYKPKNNYADITPLYQ